VIIRVFFVLLLLVAVSLEARDLVERTLERDPMKRISAKEALEHPWIVTRAPPTVVTDSSKSLTEEGPTCTVS
jgi:serine/threonine protein kinase